MSTKPRIRKLSPSGDYDLYQVTVFCSDGARSDTVAIPSSSTEFWLSICRLVKLLRRELNV